MTHLTTKRIQHWLLTKNEVLDELTARMAARRSHSFRQYQAYRRLAERMLSGPDST
jgi:hypothetical protein